MSTTVGAIVPRWCGRWENYLVRGLYCPSSCGWYCRYLWTQQRQCSEQHYCRCDLPSIVQSVGKLPCSGVVLTLSSGWHMYNDILCYPSPPTLLLGQMLPVFQLPVFHTVGGTILYFATPPLHYSWGRCCPFFIRLAARSSTVLPPPTLLLGDPSLYTEPRLNAAYFGAMSVDVSGDPFLCCPPTLCMG